MTRQIPESERDPETAGRKPRLPNLLNDASEDYRCRGCDMQITFNALAMHCKCADDCYTQHSDGPG